MQQRAQCQSEKCAWYIVLALIMRQVEDSVISQQCCDTYKNDTNTQCNKGKSETFRIKHKIPDSKEEGNENGYDLIIYMHK